MGLDQIIPVIFLIAVLFLVLPSFIETNSKLKLFIKNLLIWSVIVASIVVVTYLIF